MTTALDATALADLLDDLMAWLKANPGADLDDFAAEHNCSVEDISDSWNTYFSADFSRDYKIDTDYEGGYHPQPPPHGDPQALKSYIVQEVNTYQQYTTINNIEDNSFNQQIIAGGDVNQDINVDNSDNIADDGSVLIQDSDVDNSNIGAGDSVVGSEDVLDGDVNVSATGEGQAQSGINFGEGNVQQNQQSQDVDVTNTGDNTSGDTGSADGVGGAGIGGDGKGEADGGDGGDLDGDLPLGGDGGDGGIGTGVGGAGVGGAGVGGTSGDSGDAGNEVNVNQDAPDFNAV